MNAEIKSVEKLFLHAFSIVETILVNSDCFARNDKLPSAVSGGQSLFHAIQHFTGVMHDEYAFVLAPFPFLRIDRTIIGVTLIDAFAN